MLSPRHTAWHNCGIARASKHPSAQGPQGSSCVPRSSGKGKTQLSYICLHACLLMQVFVRGWCISRCFVPWNVFILLGIFREHPCKLQRSCTPLTMFLKGSAAASLGYFKTLNTVCFLFFKNYILNFFVYLLLEKLINKKYFSLKKNMAWFSRKYFSFYFWREVWKI